MSDTVFFIKSADQVELGQNDLLISEPDFKESIDACSRFISPNGIIGVNYLRVLCSDIGRRYDRKFSPYVNIVPSDYAGTVCLNDTDVSNLVKRMFKTTYPKMFSSYIDTLLKNRPLTTEDIYCTMDKDKYLHVFTENGLVEKILEKYSEESQEKKTKKKK